MAKFVLVFICLLDLAKAQVIEPFLIPPFFGDYPVSNVFDHKFPFPFEASGGDQLSWWGDSIVMGYDGHRAYDWRMPEGTRLAAAAAGEVVSAGSQTYFCPNPTVNRNVTGNSVTLRHEQNGFVIYTGYAHMSEVFVDVGESVEAGDTIGRSGNTGCSTAPHLHLNVSLEQEDGTVVHIDPYGWQADFLDPWESHSQGGKSHYLWLTAPLLFRETSLADDFTSTAPVWISKLRYMARDERTEPNNEFIELKLNVEEAKQGYYLGGHKLLSNGKIVYEFPKDSYIYPKKP